MKKLKIDKNYFNILIITLIVMAPFISYKYILGHDTLYHISNIDAITTDWLSLNFSKITGGLINSLGYGGSIFYPKFPHFLAAFINIPFHLLGKGPTYAMVISEIIIIFSAGILMYKLLNKLYKNSNISLIGSVFYITSSYLITDLFVRNAYNETCLFPLIPLVFLSLEYLKENNYKRFIVLFSIGYIGLINTHLVLAVYFTFLILIYFVLNYKKILSKEKIFYLIKASIIILIFCLPSLLLMIQHKQMNIYGVFSDNLMGTLDSLKAFSISLDQFIIPRYFNTVFYFLNIAELVLIIISTIYMFLNKDKELNKKIMLYGILLILSIFMSTKYFPYQLLPKLLLSIQFAYRCAIFVCFFSAIYSVYCMNYFKEKTKTKILVVSILISIIMILPILNSIDYYKTSDISWDKYAGLGFQREYLTVNALESGEYKENENAIEVLKGNDLDIKIIKNKTPNLVATINNVKGKTTLELPRFYYLGYDIRYVNESGKKYKLKYELDNEGFIKVDIKESGTLYVKYTGTMLYNIFRIIRMIFILYLIVSMIIKKKGIKKYEKK